MIPIRNINHKRVLDLSEDGRMAVIRKGCCITIITVNPDGTIHIAHEISSSQDEISIQFNSN